jgi:ABC-2 type transport system ATP-binding protein
MHETNPSAVEFDNVSLQIGKTNILNNISLTIPTNSITGILGPNGAGKSSLISLIIGLATHTNGTIIILGQKLPIKGESLRQRIGVVLQETSLYEELTVTENLLFFSSLYNVEHPKKRVNEVLELLGLLDRARDPIHILSGGLKRRITIARALLHNPEFLVVDEPTLGVDVETRHIIWEHLRYLRSKGHTILIASNYLDEVQAICDNVSVLRNGKLLITDSPKALIAKTGHSLAIDCTQQSAEKISLALSKNDGIIRTEVTSSGITVFLKGTTIPDKIVNVVLTTAPVNGFRFRPADLVEIFESLEKSNILDSTATKNASSAATKNIFARYPILFTLSLILILCCLLLAEIWLSQPR